MSIRAWGPALGVAAIVGGDGCASRQVWQHDESRRIEEIMSSEKLSGDLAALNGTAFATPPSNAPPLAASSYEIQRPPPKKRSKPHRNARGTKRRSRRDDDLTAPASGEDSVSRRP